MEKVEVYLKAQQQKEINVIKVKLADICQVWCGDEKYMSKINNLVLYEFKPREEKRTYKKVFSILDIIDKINKSFPEVTSWNTPARLMSLGGKMLQKSFW